MPDMIVVARAVDQDEDREVGRGAAIIILLVVLIDVVGTLGGCVSRKTFPCGNNSPCDDGMCVGGWCAFADPTCPTGYRYGDLAGDGLARACVTTGGNDVDAGSFTCPGHPPDYCDVFTGCGCDTASGDKCIIQSDIGYSCLGAGAGGEGASCVDDSDCAVGLLCNEAFGECMPYCDASHPCRAGDACAQDLIDSAGVVDGHECLPTCNLLAQDCVITGIVPLSCQEDSLAVSDPDRGVCAAAGGGTQDASCRYDGDCVLGDTCVPPDGWCSQFCAMSGGAPSCPSSYVCFPRAAGGSTGDCTKTCDPLSSGGCTVPGEGCYVDPIAGVDLGVCFAPGTGGPGASCTYGTDCEVGFGCASNVCGRVCNASAPSCPDAGQTHCALISGETRVGFCVP
jgi:hypothetical protein